MPVIVEPGARPGPSLPNSCWRTGSGARLWGFSGGAREKCTD